MKPELITLDELQRRLEWLARCPDALRYAHLIDWSETVGERLDWHEALRAVQAMGDVDLEWASRHPDKIPYVRGWMEARS